MPVIISFISTRLNNWINIHQEWWFHDFCLLRLSFLWNLHKERWHPTLFPKLIVSTDNLPIFYLVQKKKKKERERERDMTSLKYNSISISNRSLRIAEFYSSGSDVVIHDISLFQNTYCKLSKLSVYSAWMMENRA